MTAAELTLGSLFDGIAGFPLAAVRHGIKTLWTSEIEPNCVEIAARHFPEAKQLGDITKLNGADLDPVDIISFGSPCQNLSTAGNQKGLKGEKSGLFFEAIRIVYEMRGATDGRYPKYIIWENVEGAFSSNKGQDFRRVLEEITKTNIPMPNTGRWAAAGMVGNGGSCTAWRELDAQYWGVPQRRKRIYLVHSFGSERAGQILFECESVFRDIAQSGSEGQKTSPGTGRSTAAADGTPTVYTIAGNAIGRTGRNGGNQLGIGQDISYTLTAADRHCVVVPDFEAFRLYGYGKYKEGVGTLRATRGDCGGSETLIVEKGSLYHARRQTPTECERLNGFPDGWTKYDTKNKEISDAARYTALGNSIAIPCAERVFMGICRAEEQEVRQMDIDREAETDGLTVLSLFDGISCGRIALERAGIKVKKYYASEIKKAAMDVTMEHYPDTIQIGDVKNVWYNNGTLYTENGTFEVGKIDLLIGGSPCQDFSVARVSMGTKTIDGLNGEKSSLFYEYLRLKRMVNPSFFLLENVKMKKDSEHELNKYMGVDGIHINSSLVSFQTRERIYWSNIKGIEPPEDRKISFQDHKDTEAEYCRQFKVKRTKSRERMWNNGRGRETSSNCTNITHAEKVGCITRKQDRCPNSGLIEFEDFCRYLTRREIEKAQTLPVGYTDNLTYGQMQDVCGDGWTVDVVAHIFGFLRKEVESGGK